MRKAEFNVPQEDMAAFANELAKRNLESTLNGANEDNEVAVEVSYEKDESEEVDEMEDILEKMIAGDYEVEQPD